MRIAYFDCFSGISGDMTLGALVDAGVDPEAITGAVAKLGLNCPIQFEAARRCTFRATYARVEAPHEHAHRNLSDIETLIDRAELQESQADLAKRIFRKLGQAEARAHGIPIEQVHFHEVGAVDSIVDIVGTAVGLDLLGVDRIESSPVPTGIGWVRGAHGRMPLPTPGTAELLKGVSLAESNITMEQTTPTGAAILATVVEAFGPRPSMTVEAVGHGAGTRDLPDQPNMLRIFVGQAVAHDLGGERLFVLETNLDDVPGELVGHALTKLLETGARDAFITPILMKKNRPACMITALCDEATVDAAEQVLFRETSTLGIRRYAVRRRALHRRLVRVETTFGSIGGKLSWIGAQAPRFSPEYDDCVRIAQERDVPLPEVYEAARAAGAKLAADAAPPSLDADPHGHQHGHHHHDHGSHGHHHHHEHHGHSHSHSHHHEHHGHSHSHSHHHEHHDHDHPHDH